MLRQVVVGLGLDELLLAHIHVRRTKSLGHHVAGAESHRAHGILQPLGRHLAVLIDFVSSEGPFLLVMHGLHLFDVDSLVSHVALRVAVLHH